MKRFFITIILSLVFSSAFSQIKDIEILNFRDLTFGTIVPGTSSSVSTTSSNAGRFSILLGRNNTTASVTFSLPPNLTSGVNNLPVTFTATKSLNSNDGQLGESFDPYSGTTIQRTVGNTKDWYIRIGGVIQAPAVQAAGNYNGSITITLAIIGI